MEAIDRAASKVAYKFELDADDLAQEATIMVTDLTRNLAECIPANIGMLQYRLEQDLVDAARTEVSRRNRAVSYEVRTESDEYAPRPAAITIRQEVGGYTRELVESLIPAVWDESFCYGIRVENAPDGDMPRGSTNKATGNTLAAHIADIKTGWQKAPLTLLERRVLLLGYAMDWTQREIAFNLSVDQATVSRNLYSGVGKIVAELNGDYALMAEVASTHDDLVAA